MRTVEDILLAARRLSRQEYLMLLERLEEALETEDCNATGEPRGPGAYSRSLALAGTVHSEFTDLSTDKYRHVADAIAGIADP